MKVLIVGSRGYIGRNLVKKLTDLNIKVIEESSSLSELFDPISGIVFDSFSIPSDTKCIVYLSQSPYYRQQPEKIEHLWGVNTLSPIKIANMARLSGVKKFVYASTGNVYSPSFSTLSEKDPIRRDDWYALSKIHAEECLLNFSNDMEIVCTRLFGIYGPNQTNKLIPNLINSVKSKIPINLELQPGSLNYGLNISLCYIQDVTDILANIATSQLGTSEVINIAGNETLNIGEVAREIGCLLNIKPLIKLSKSHRNFDLISNNTKLVNLYNPIFTPFKVGIKETLGLL
jgi:UDP-glucose 4-epimerase